MEPAILFMRVGFERRSRLNDCRKQFLNAVYPAQTKAVKYKVGVPVTPLRKRC